MEARCTEKPRDRPGVANLNLSKVGRDARYSKESPDASGKKGGTAELVRPFIGTGSFYLGKSSTLEGVRAMEARK